MSSNRPPAQAVRAGDMAPLAERMGHLQALRACFALAFVVVGARLASGTPEMDDLARITIAYLALISCVEVLRRIGGRRRLAVVAAMLLLDCVFLAAGIHLTGGTESSLNVLVYVHLIAVTLLASYRTGLKLALWYSLLFLVIFFSEKSMASAETSDGAAGLVAATSQIAVFWLVSLGTAIYSALNERELRRNRVQLEALATMARELETTREPEAVATVLLSKVVEAFGFSRGAVIGCEHEDITLLAVEGTQNREVDWSEMDSVIRKAWDQKRISLVRRLDPQANSRLDALFPAARNLVIAPMLEGDRPIGALVVESGPGPRQIETRTVSMIGQLASHAALALRNSWLVQQLRKMAETDPLTELANRRTFKAVLEREVSRALRRSEQMALVMLDLDHFKGYNDQYGHPAGDDLLRATARVLRDTSRQYDTVARYGGEEFAVILPACSPAKAQELGERLRESVARTEALTTITASAGVAIFPVHGRDPEELIRAADGALYESKRRGRDRVTLARAGSAALAPMAQ